MTRINLIPPRLLSREHLIAEYKEIMRLPGNLKTSLERKGKPFDVKEIPPSYVLGKGHVKFFYDKFEFLKKRFELLVEEIINRGYKPNYLDSSIFNTETRYMNDYIPTTDEIKLNIRRINERGGSITSCVVCFNEVCTCR